MDPSSISDLFASLDRHSSTNFDYSSDYRSGSNANVPLRVRPERKPVSLLKADLRNVLENIPDFSSYERHNLVVESQQSNENFQSTNSDSKQSQKLHEDNPKSSSHSIGVPKTPLEVWCSTPGPEDKQENAKGLFKRDKALRMITLENIPYSQEGGCGRYKAGMGKKVPELGIEPAETATPIPCPEPPKEGSPMCISLAKSAQGQSFPRDATPILIRDTSAMDKEDDPTDKPAPKRITVVGPWNADGGKKSEAFIKRLTRRFRIDNMILNQSYWELFEAGDSKGTLLKICDQSSLKKFSDVFTPYRRRHLAKIGEGCFGEVFRCPAQLQAPQDAERKKQPSVALDAEELVAVKLVPVEGSVKFNGDSQKSFSEVLSEVIIAKELTALSYGMNNQTDGFVQLKKVHLVSGAFPPYLTRAWEMYDKEKGSENDHPNIFPKNQVWLVIESLFGGSALEDTVVPCPAARLSIFQQVALSLAVAEAELKFEHRDLHWGNVLARFTCPAVSSSSCSFCDPEVSSTCSVTFRLDGRVFNVPTHSVRTVIIDFTLSRLEQGGGLVYVDLSEDPTLFESTGDYQFDVYRLMRDHNRNQWKSFNPETNVMWLNYLLKKLILSGPSRSQTNPTHSHCAKLLNSLAVDLETRTYKSASDLVLNHPTFADKQR